MCHRETRSGLFPGTLPREIEAKTRPKTKISSETSVDVGSKGLKFKLVFVSRRVGFFRKSMFPKRFSRSAWANSSAIIRNYENQPYEYNGSELGLGHP